MNAVNARRAWARRFLSRCSGPIPEYGSESWIALDDSDPAKVAAVVRAAEREAVGRQLDDLTLRAELDAAAAQRKAAEDAAWQAAGRAHKAAWDGRAGRFRRDEQIAAEVEQDWREWASGVSA